MTVSASKSLPTAQSPGPPEKSIFGKAIIGILVKDVLHRRLIESAAVQLELAAQDLDPASFETGLLASFEMIVADEEVARHLSQTLRAGENRADGISPAIIAIRRRDAKTADTGRTAPGRRLPGEPLQTVASPVVRTVARVEQEFDALLDLPMELPPIVAQLSIVLYSHRAFARRYHSALEELHLNRRIFRSVTSGISVADATLPDMPLTYVNPAFEVMTGYTLEEVQGKNCRFLQGDEHIQPGLTMIREALAAKREVTAVIRNYRKDGTFFWNELSLSPIRNRVGEITHFVGIQTDITARVEFEAALRESEKLAAVGRLASSIAHEINNPLEAVTNLLYLAQYSGGLQESKSYLASAEKELRRVSLITSQSLRFYKQSTKPQAITSTALLESVLDLYQGKLDNAGVHVERRERLAQSFVCMESEIRQVLNNLIRNALDSMGNGGRLLIRSREATNWRNGAHGVLITVADTGTGISPETMKQIYKAFFTTKGIGGTGLGLWISSEIVERHQGRLRVRSRMRNQGRGGTVFELFLPFQGIAA